MTNVTRPALVILLMAIFVVAAVAGGPANGFEVALMQQLAGVRAERPWLTVSFALLIGRRLGALEPQHQVVGRHRPALPEDETA